MWRAIVVSLLCLGCSSDSEPSRDWPTTSELGFAEASEQRPGDPIRGRDALINEGIVRCGVPYSAYEQVFDPVVSSIEGRRGRNTELPFEFTAATNQDGVEIVSANCMTCHAEVMNGQVVIGLGNVSTDFTQEQAGLAILARGLVSDPAEVKEIEKFTDRLLVASPYTVMSTIGVNPADNLAAILFAHRDPKTLEWSNSPLMEPPPNFAVPVDVPPWWRMHNKNAMFYVAAGRGDHSRHMMTASSLCTDNVEEAEAIDRFMPDVAAYIRSIEPPPFPAEVNAELAAEGEEIFGTLCSRCHGSYGETRDQDDYPNLVFSADDVGTDQTLALGASFFGERFVDWFNESYYGENGYIAPAPGYYAPSLRGIWPTAPYFHNGSVPDMEGVLNSQARPRYWTRNFNLRDYSLETLGFRFTELEGGKSAEPNERNRAFIYDTTELGYGNGGHTYGDELTPEQRQAVIEYLKTL